MAHVWNRANLEFDTGEMYDFWGSAARYVIAFNNEPHLKTSQRILCFLKAVKLDFALTGIRERDSLSGILPFLPSPVSLCLIV